jgi:hypothetical protein
MAKFKFNRFNPNGTEALGTIYIDTRVSETKLHDIIENVVNGGVWEAGWNGWDKSEKGFKIHFDMTHILDKDNFDTYEEFYNERNSAVKDLVNYVCEAAE